MGWVVLGFLTYHLWLVARGVTTNESFKWREVQAALAEQAEQAALMGRVEQLLGGEGEGGGGSWAAGSASSSSSSGGSSGGEAPQQPQQHHHHRHRHRHRHHRPGGGGAASGCVQLPPNAYDRGVLRNFSEILWPGWHLRHAAAAKKHA